MKILYSVQSIHPPLTGVGRYALHLAQGLAARADVDIEFFSGRQRVPLPTQETAKPGWARRLKPWVPCKPLARRAYHRLRNWSAEAQLKRMHGRYVFHEPNYMLGPYQGPSLITVHDLSHIHYPQYHPADRIDYFERNLPASLERADHVFTVSDFVRDEIIQLLNVPAERVTRVYNGVDDRYVPRDRASLAPVLARYGLADKTYLLVVGTLEPRKNLRTLVEAFCQLPQAWQERFPLVLVGSRGWIDGDFIKQLERLSASGRVIWPGYVPEQDLPLLYAGAHGFAFPSIYEGFGLPALEAMACGVPVLVGRRSSLPEVVGDVGLQVDTESVQALKQGLQQLMEDTLWREQAGPAGVERAKLFSWQRCVEETLAVYRQVAKANGLAAQ
jgi:alpha-1,3-rhamnosyl/mannosyltransferase